MRRTTFYVILAFAIVALVANALLFPYGDVRLVVVGLAFVGIIAALMVEGRHQRRAR